MEEKEVKKITLGLVLGWIFGVIFLLVGFISIFSTGFLVGFLMMLLGFILLPLANIFLANKLGFVISGGLKFILVLVLFGLIGIVAGGKAEEEGFTIKDTDRNTPDVEVVSEEQEEIVVQYTEVNMEDFLSEYDKNKLAAQEKWTGKNIQTTGYISNISSTLGTKYISVDFSKDAFLENSISCYPTTSQDDVVLGLENGQRITVRGEVQDMSIMSVGLKNCEIVLE